MSAAFGLTAGVASSVAHSGGIVLGPYLIGLGLGNAAVVATANAVVAVTNLVKLGGYWAIGFLTGRILLAAVAALPLLALGTWVGWRLNRWLPPRARRRRRAPAPHGVARPPGAGGLQSGA